MRALTAAGTKDGISAVRRGAGRLDLLMPVLPLFQRIAEQAEEREVMGRPVRVARAEHVMALKVLAFREQDRVDIRHLVRVQAARLDRALLWAEVDGILPADDSRRAWLAAELAGPASPPPAS